jgi:hypothetical protein
MECHDQQALPHELVHLMEKQIESLEKETFGRLTYIEGRQYEERQDRIDELCEALRYLHSAAQENGGGENRFGGRGASR